MNYHDLFIESKLPHPFSQSELCNYFERMNDGDKTARNEIIKHNIRLVINEVKKSFYNNNYDKQELVSIGLIGLIKSVDSFDTSKNIKFSTYAIKCIDNEILMFMRKEIKYKNDNSLDMTIGHDSCGNELKVKDVLYDYYDFTTKYDNQESFRSIRKIIFDLPYKDSEIIKKYFGFQDCEPMKQAEIAKFLGISQSYVSRIIKEILKKISLELQKQGLIERNSKSKEKNYKE